LSKANLEKQLGEKVSLLCFILISLNSSANEKVIAPGLDHAVNLACHNNCKAIASIFSENVLEIISDHTSATHLTLIPQDFSSSIGGLLP
jgi:hypothetical protein